MNDRTTPDVFRFPTALKIRAMLADRQMSSFAGAADECTSLLDDTDPRSPTRRADPFLTRTGQKTRPHESAREDGKVRAPVWFGWQRPDRPFVAAAFWISRPSSSHAEIDKPIGAPEVFTQPTGRMRFSDRFVVIEIRRT